VNALVSLVFICFESQDDGNDIYYLFIYDEIVQEYTEKYKEK